MEKFTNEEINKLGEDYNNPEKNWNLWNSCIQDDNCSNNDPMRDCSDFGRNLWSCGTTPDNRSNKYYYGDAASAYANKVFSEPYGNNDTDNTNKPVSFKRPVMSSVVFTSPYYSVPVLTCILNAYANNDIEDTIQNLKKIKVNMYQTCRHIIDAGSPMYEFGYPSWVNNARIGNRVKQQVEQLCDDFCISGSWYGTYADNITVLSCALYMLTADLINWFEEYRDDNDIKTTNKSND